MPALPWTYTSRLDPDTEYLVMVSTLPLTRRSATLRWFRAVQQVRRQLAGADGLVGYSLDAHPISNVYWTLSIWRSREDLNRFVAANPHETIMGSFAGALGPTGFDFWTARGSELPPSWPDARARLSTPGT